MNDARTRRRRLDESRRPVAMVHDGVYVYANPAFLRVLGYREFGQLEATPVLDTVVERHHQRLRTHLVEAAGTPEAARERPSARLTLVRGDGRHEVVIASSCATRFDGEGVVQMTLRTREDARLANRLRTAPWKLYLSIFFLLLFTLLPVGLLLKLNINNAPKIYLPPDAPSVVIDDQVRAVFPSDQTILLLFEGVALYSDGFLTAFDRLARSLEQHPLVDEVMSVTTQDHISGSEEGFEVTPVIDVAELAGSTPATRRDRALSDRFSRRALVAADGSALSLLVIPVPIDNSIERMRLEEEILQRVRAARLGGYLSARAGQITLDVAQLRSMLRDNMTFIPLTVAIGLLLIWWLFRRWLAVIVSGIVIGVVVSSTVAFYVLFSQPFNLISSIIPPLLSALTVAALVHLFNALYHASRRGLVGPDRVARALEEIRRPVFYTSATTMAGLASLGLSPIPPIRSFGLISAAGVGLICFVVLYVVPSIFSRFDYAPWPRSRSGLRLMDALVRRLFHLGVRHPAAVTGVTLVLLLLSAPLVLRVQVETNLQEFFYPDHPVRVDTDHVEAKLVGTTSLDVVFRAGTDGGLRQPEVLQAMRRFQRWAESLPEVDKSISLADFVEEMNWGFHAEDDAFRRIPEDPRLISQYLLVYDGDDLYDFADRNFRFGRVSLNANVHGANRISELMARIRDYLEQDAPPGVSWEIAGFGRLFADQEDLLVQGQIYSLLGALGLIFLLMLVQWRSLGGALLCMIPNLSPILLIFIVMGAFGIWLDMATAMIASVAVGIAVDDTIHVYHGFVSRVRRGVSPVVALARTYHQAGRAVMTTTIILSAQFLVLVFSQFVPTTHFGLLTAIGLVAALLFDLVLLPALLILIHAWRTRPLKVRRPLEL